VSTPFLIGFARVLLVQLLAEKLIEVQPGHEDRVILYVADYLAQAGEGASLVSSLARALLTCPQVVELYAEDRDLKRVVQELEGTPALWVRG
jgi:hypothetical protein